MFLAGFAEIFLTKKNNMFGRLLILIILIDAFVF